MKTLTSKLPTVARIVLGGIFFVFGLNGFLHFAPVPPMPGPAGAFLGALVATGYLFPLVKATETVAGALLLSGRFVPLALILLAPVLVNIVAFHAALAPTGIAVPLLLLAAELYLAWSYRHVFAPLVRARIAPAQPQEHRSHPIGSAEPHGHAA